VQLPLIPPKRRGTQGVVNVGACPVGEQKFDNLWRAGVVERRVPNVPLAVYVKAGLDQQFDSPKIASMGGSVKAGIPVRGHVGKRIYLVAWVVGLSNERTILPAQAVLRRHLLARPPRRLA